MTLSKTIKALTMAAITSVSLSAMAANVAPTEPQLSVQLWSVKDDVAKDFEGTLKKLKAMGFDGVEFAGNFGAYANDPKGLKAFLDKTGLKASAAHVPFEKLNAENFDKTVAFYKAIDCKYLIIPMDMRAFTTDGAKEVAAELAAIQTKLTPHGMHTGYHNHEGEMLGEMGKTPWDVIGTNTSQEVVLQQDVGWTEVAGKDPIAFIKAYPGRTITTHYKASAPKPGNTEHPIIGQDTTDWKALINANKTYGGTLWLVVEQESYPEGMTPMQSVEASLKGLQKVISDMK
ncbi:sugar phosphate isomerase [Cellvibrio mixtus]|jgi:sugar phosphate isomerase/epimerase|uniref:Sugar phosphate isomerase n=1 Tax=Cellvibrio mixtus TaxID=39650 RepID=A0A266QAN8_9GAMM|nr:MULTISPECIES: sugar phosphate isomerase/epimerase [Cellvibrio]AQT60637.1 sugar phosphate isomerase [Cellvibrio sp. PSBB023]OZY86953.1 sugar phosphate isomerase [Cellvibrio mixtus]